MNDHKGFFAMMARMKYIERWALMRNSVSENICEHSLEVAMLAHGLGIIGRKRFGKDLSPERLAMLGMYHDCTEIITGDMPTPVKYANDELKEAYKAIEDSAAQRLLEMLPEALREIYTPLVMESDEDLNPIVKAADKLSAYIKCVEEQKAGNTEFDSAAEQTMQALHAMDRPELEWFLDQCLPAFSKNLDQL